MDYLTEEQKESFAATNALFGLGPTEFTAHLSDEELASLPATRIMSSDSDESHFPPHHVAVGSIAELRKLAGFPEEYIDNGQEEPDYPEPPGEDEINSIAGYSAKPTIDDDLKRRIRQAAECYVMGNPAKVKDYEPLINATMFPGQVAVFTGDILNVPDGQTHVIGGDDPVIINYCKIIVGVGATVSVETHHVLNTQIFIQV